MRRILFFSAALGLLMLVVLGPLAPQSVQDFRKASVTLVASGYKALEADKDWDALKLFEQAVVANPRNIAAYIGLGKAHEALGSISGGLKYYAIALELDPTHLPAWEAQVLAHLAKKEPEKAEKSLDQMLQVCTAADCAELIRAREALEAYQSKTVATADPS